MESIDLGLVEPKEFKVNNSLAFLTITLFILFIVIPDEYMSQANRALFLYIPFSICLFFLLYIHIFLADYKIYGKIVLEKNYVNIFIDGDNSPTALNAPVEIHIIDYESIIFGARTFYKISGAQNHISAEEGKFFFLLYNKKKLRDLRHFLKNYINPDKFVIFD